MRTSSLAGEFTESVIREMTRLITLHHGEAGINLAQGFPDFPAPAALKDAACTAIQADINQYAITWGAPVLRTAIAEAMQRLHGLDVDPQREVTVCCGATEAMLAALLALVERGDEVVVFQPFYENYGPDCAIAGARPRHVALRAPAWDFDADELRAAFGPRTRAVIVNTPHNPTGKVFSVEELTLIAQLCTEHDAVAITDEIYEHLVYEGRHIPIATLPGMAERTVTINGLSKTYSVTGWRVGWAVAPPEITGAIRRVHDFLTVGAAAPLQVAAATALGLGDEYLAELLGGYRRRRDHLVETLLGAGFACRPPQGAYYVMTDIAGLTDLDDVAFVDRMVREIGVAAVPGSSFYAEPALGRTQVRFAFPKRLETLAAARERLAAVSSWRPAGSAAG